MEQLTSALIAGAVSIIGAIVLLVCSRIRSKAIQSMQNEINTVKQVLANSDKLYYVECPQCHTRVYLSHANIGVTDKPEIDGNSNTKMVQEFKAIMDDAVDRLLGNDEKKNNNGGIMDQEKEKREIELIAQVRASYDVIGNALHELEAMHANLPVAETETPAEAPAEPEPEVRQEDGAKDETEATNIDNAEKEVENTEDKSEADDETKYYY